MVNQIRLISYGGGSTYNSLKRKLIDFLASVGSEEFPVFPAHLSKEVERGLERGGWRGLTVTNLFTHQSVRNPSFYKRPCWVVLTPRVLRVHTQAVTITSEGKRLGEPIL